jgi:hypothetical protein
MRWETKMAVPKRSATIKQPTMMETTNDAIPIAECGFVAEVSAICSGVWSIEHTTASSEYSAPQ